MTGLGYGLWFVYDLWNFYSLCCTFLAFKIDEYNVTLEQFIETLSPFFSNQQLQHISDFILGHEVCYDNLGRITYVQCHITALCLVCRDCSVS